MDYYTAIVQYGDEGADVLFLQRQLRFCGFHGAALDGDFGNDTKNSVLRAQSYFGIPADGICGPQTWRCLYDYVAKVQMQLNARFGENLEIDGNVGSSGVATIHALQRAQQKSGIADDWMIGPATEKILDMVGWMKADLSTAENPTNTGGGNGASPIGDVGTSNRGSGYTVALRAGHTKTDPGACAYNNQERVWNLEVCNRLYPMLTQNGFKVVPICLGAGDEVSTYEGCEIANKAGAHIFASVHHNAGRGEYATAVAHPNSADGIRLGNIAIRRVAAALGISQGALIRDADFNEVRYTDMPAIISEGCFVDNPNHVHIMNNGGFQAEAEGLFYTVCEYFGV